MGASRSTTAADPEADSSGAGSSAEPMLTIIETGHPHVAGFKIDGKLEKSDVDLLVDHTKAKLQGMADAGDERGLRVYVEVVQFGGISLEGLVAEVKGIFPHLGDLKKKAVVSNLSWADTLTKLFQPIGKRWIEGRHFSPAEKADALAWAAE